MDYDPLKYPKILNHNTDDSKQAPLLLTKLLPLGQTELYIW